MSKFSGSARELIIRSRSSLLSLLSFALLVRQILTDSETKLEPDADSAPGFLWTAVRDVPRLGELAEQIHSSENASDYV
ncbi:MAG: hypothetical protein Q9165_002981 [Trypethelium subeluteriae]